MKILPVIMCGGSGTRVWPESRLAVLAADHVVRGKAGFVAPCVETALRRPR